MKEQPSTGGRFSRNKGNGGLKQVQKPTAEQKVADSATDAADDASGQAPADTDQKEGN